MPGEGVTSAERGVVLVVDKRLVARSQVDKTEEVDGRIHNGHADQCTTSGQIVGS